MTMAFERRRPTRSHYWSGISPLQEQYPSSVGQWIGRNIEVDGSIPQVRYKNLHNPIESHIVGPRLSIPNLRLPEHGEPNSMARIPGADFSILMDRPVAITIRLNLCRR